MQEDVDKLVLLYGRWRGLPTNARVELIASSFGDRASDDITRHLEKLRIGSNDKKGARKRAVVGEDDAEQVPR